MTLGSVFFSFANKCGFCFSFGCTKLTVVSFFYSFFALFIVQYLCSLLSVDAFFHFYLCCMTLEMTYFCAEYVLLTVGWSAAELVPHDPIVLWMSYEWDNVNNHPQTAEVGFRIPNCGNWVFVIEFWGSVQFGSKPISDILIMSKVWYVELIIIVIIVLTCVFDVLWSRRAAAYSWSEARHTLSAQSESGQWRRSRNTGHTQSSHREHTYAHISTYLPHVVVVFVIVSIIIIIVITVIIV